MIRIAYELFTVDGLAAVGVDRIVAEANVAKTTLYRQFRSKDDLVAAVLERHLQLWLTDWLEPQTRRRRSSPVERLVAVFDTLEEWFADENFHGCLLINSLVETHERPSATRRAAVDGLEDVAAFLERLAAEAEAREPKRLALQLHLLVRGTIVAATQGAADAVREARGVARQLIDNGVPHPAE